MHNPYTNNYRAVLQITTSSPGWEAVYAGRDEGYWTLPVVCWAVVQWAEKGSGTVTTGLVLDPGYGELAYAMADKAFLGYTYPEDTTNWQQRAERYRAQRK